MRYLKIRLILLLILGWVSSTATQAQSYVDGLLSHKITVHYPDHTVIAVVKPTGIVATQSDATYYWFSGNQINTTQGGYSGKLLNGNYQDFYLNKNLKEAGAFEQGLKTGRWKSWSDDGVLKDEYTFKSGIKNGDYVKYDLVGKAFEKGSYQQDKLNGKQVTMVGDSAVAVYYQHGKIKEKKSIVPGFIYKIFPKRTNKPINQDSISRQPANGQPIGNLPVSSLPLKAQP